MYIFNIGKTYKLKKVLDYMKNNIKKSKIILFLLFSCLFLLVMAELVSAGLQIVDANNFASASGSHYSSIRGNARGQSSLHLSTGSVVNYQVSLVPNTVYRLIIRYSNDGPSESILMSLNGIGIGKFNTISTGSGGYGWNSFTNSGEMYFKTKNAGQYTITLQVRSGDSFGVEIDVLGFLS